MTFSGFPSPSVTGKLPQKFDCLRFTSGAYLDMNNVQWTMYNVQ